MSEPFDVMRRAMELQAKPRRVRSCGEIIACEFSDAPIVKQTFQELHALVEDYLENNVAARHLKDMTDMYKELFQGGMSDMLAGCSDAARTATGALILQEAAEKRIDHMLFQRTPQEINDPFVTGGLFQRTPQEINDPFVTGGLEYWLKTNCEKPLSPLTEESFRESMRKALTPYVDVAREPEPCPGCFVCPAEAPPRMHEKGCICIVNTNVEQP